MVLDVRRGVSLCKGVGGGQGLERDRGWGLLGARKVLFSEFRINKFCFLI